MIAVDNYKPLRFQISSWRQLPGCKSNNSKHLSLHVSDLFDGNTLNGFRIILEHDKYGILFATVINAQGNIISPESDSPENDLVVHNLPDSEILAELAKYGFYIDFHKNKHLSGDQISYLLTVQKLHYNKVRLLNVWDASTGVKEFTRHLVVFKEENLGRWLNNGYSPSIDEFTNALINGYAIDITHVCCAPRFDWSWLDFVANIDDIVRDDSGDCLNTIGDREGGSLVCSK